MDIKQIAADEADIILGLEEGHFRDLKAREIAPAKLSQTVSAFANSAGGELFIGIAETRTGEAKSTEWLGFPDQEAVNPILAMLEGLGAPDFTHMALLQCEGRAGYVLHLVIQKTRHIVLATDQKPYVRRGAQKLPVITDDAKRRLELDKGIATYEDQTVSIPADIVTNSITILEFVLCEVPSAEPDRWLRSQFLIHEDKPTVAAALLFADEPQAILPKRSSVKIFRYKTADEGLDRETLAFSPITIEGPICDLIKKAVFSTKEIVESIKKIGEGGLEDITYPDETLHEIITNAVLHRDYSIPTDIQIRIYDDRVEVHSPGRLPGHITIPNMLDEQFARNPKLVRLANKFPDAPNKDVGEGLNTAFQAMRKIRLKDPEIVEHEQSVAVYIRHTRLSTPAQIVMEYVEKNPTITNQIGRNITGLRRDVQVKDLFVALRKQGLIDQVPGKRGRATAWHLVRKADVGDCTQVQTDASTTVAPPPSDVSPKD